MSLSYIVFNIGVLSSISSQINKSDYFLKLETYQAKIVIKVIICNLDNLVIIIQKLKVYFRDCNREVIKELS
jgi:hypothetical protein